MPLLFYGVTSINDKRSLNKHGLYIMASSFLCIFFGFLLIFCVSRTAGTLCLVFSCILAIVMLYLTYQLQPSNRSILSVQVDVPLEYKIKWNIQRKNRRLLVVLCLLIPTFPTVYFLSLSKVLDRDRTKVAFSICNVSAKIIYAIVLMLSHSECIQQLYVAECSANAARRQFVRYVMHEVRVPLNSVTAGIGVMDKQPLDDDGRDTLQVMKAATSYMSSTLNNVLSMQKIEEGKFELNMAPFILEDFLVTVTSALHSMMLEKEIRFEAKIAQEVPPCVVGDRYRLEHVLANLLSNAIKFSPSKGKIDLLISVLSAGRGISIGKVSSSSSELRFSVTDQGPGLSEANMMTLFQPFTQLNASELQRGGGTGVGLSICKQIIELHRGRLEVQSKVGHGSTFSFGIPCVPAMLSGCNTPTRQPSDIDIPPGLSSRMSVALGEVMCHRESSILRPSATADELRTPVSTVDDSSPWTSGSFLSTSSKVQRRALVVDGKRDVAINVLFESKCFSNRCHIQSQATVSSASP